MKTSRGEPKDIELTVYATDAGDDVRGHSGSIAKFLCD